VCADLRGAYRRRDFRQHQSGWALWGLSSSDDKTLRLWELATGRCVRTFEGHTGSAKSVAISPDGRWGLSGSKMPFHVFSEPGHKTVRLLELATGRCVRTFEGHTEAVNSVAISPDGRWGLSGSDDKTLRLWELATGKCVRTFEGHTDDVFSVAISPDGRWALSGSYDKTLRLWELDWECEFPPPADWDEGARPYLENFLSLHTPYAASLPRDRQPSEEEVQHALTRRGTPSWTEDDLKDLLNRLCYAGYGWLRPQGVRKKLEEMAAIWTASPPPKAPSRPTGAVAPPGPSHGVPASISARAETDKIKAAPSNKDAHGTVVQAPEELARLKQTPRPGPLPTVAAASPTREGARGQPDAQQALLLKKIVEQLEAVPKPGVAQQPRDSDMWKAKPQPAPTPKPLPQRKAAAHPARARKNRGISWRLLDAGLTFKLGWLAGWLVLILDQVAGKFFSSHFLPASEFRTTIDRWWEAGALGVASILLFMIAPFVIERVAAGRKSSKKGG